MKSIKIVFNFLVDGLCLTREEFLEKYEHFWAIVLVIFFIIIFIFSVIYGIKSYFEV